MQSKLSKLNRPIGVPASAAKTWSEQVGSIVLNWEEGKINDDNASQQLHTAMGMLGFQSIEIDCREDELIVKKVDLTWVAARGVIQAIRYFKKYSLGGDDGPILRKFIVKNWNDPTAMLTLGITPRPRFSQT